MEYREYAELTGRPHVVVDGSAQAGTELVLSHWPGAATPDILRADLSAEIAFNYLDHPELHVDAPYVTNNHFDQDGLVAVFALTQPEAAQARWPKHNLERAGTYKAFNRLCQGGAAGQTKRALLEINKAVGLPQMTVHDEVSKSVSSEKETKLMNEIMINCIPLLSPVRADLELKDHWS